LTAESPRSSHRGGRFQPPLRREDHRDRLDFRYQLFGHDNIRLETVTDLLALGKRRNGDLSRERDACAPWLDAQALSVDGSSNAAPVLRCTSTASPMTCSVNDTSGPKG
jgi:hypothetical protein